MLFPEEPADLFEIENIVYRCGYQRVVGIDEAGRGPLAGPVVAAAVMLPRGCTLEGLADSKTLTAARRQALYERLAAAPEVVTAVVAMAPSEIDRLNILRATHAAMRRAVARVCPAADFILVDGRPVPDLPCAARNIIKGDAKCACVAAAGIIAKVTRDRLMCDADREYPEYGFRRHKGYGTKAHIAVLNRLGPSPIHRFSFAPVAAADGAGSKQTQFEFMDD